MVVVMNSLHSEHVGHSREWHRVTVRGSPFQGHVEVMQPMDSGQDKRFLRFQLALEQIGTPAPEQIDYSLGILASASVADL